MKAAIVIPARYGSTRFPGKPLALIGGRSMLSRVVEIAQIAVGKSRNIDIIIATEDDRILAHANTLGVNTVMTPKDCPTGSDRALAAVKAIKREYEFVINFQGDAPFTPPIVLESLLDALKKHKNKIEVITPFHYLTWDELSALRESKITTPFSGTTLIRHEGKKGSPLNGMAIWFSKQIIPAIRKEDRSSEYSPVMQHIGIYGYHIETLKRFVKLPQSKYEKLEGLEQLRMLEAGISIFTAKVEFEKTDYPLKSLQRGIDSPEDLKRANKILAKHGEPPWVIS